MVPELAPPFFRRTITTPGLDSGSLDERVEDVPPAEAPDGTASGGSAAAPGDGMPAPPDVRLAASSPREVGSVTLRSAPNLRIDPNCHTYLDGFTGERLSRLKEEFLQVWRRIKKKVPRRIDFPVGFTTDQYVFLDDKEVEDVKRIKDLLDDGGFIASPHDFPTFTWDAVATSPPYLRNDDPHVRHFDMREEKIHRRGAYMVRHAQV